MKKSVNSLEHLELKYCERCGGLWLRREGSDRIYCVSCFPVMSEVPAGRNPLPVRLRLPIGNLHLEGSRQTGFCFVGGER
jgi:hypothetical protein